jgi:hypothetical protein
LSWTLALTPNVKWALCLKYIKLGPLGSIFIKIGDKNALICKNLAYKIRYVVVIMDTYMWLHDWHSKWTWGFYH